MTTAEKTAFINKYQNDIIKSTIGTKIFPSVKMAQACLETGFGKTIVLAANNLFGIKAGGSYTPYWKGKTVTHGTHEEYSGRTVSIADNFRAYDSVEDSIRDHTYFIEKYSRYLPVLAATTPEEQCQQLQNCGYATDTSYASKLLYIINMFNLRELDKKKV